MTKTAREADLLQALKHIAALKGYQPIDTARAIAQGAIDLAEEQAREDAAERVRRHAPDLLAALKTIAATSSVNLSGEWEAGLRGMIRSMADCARSAIDLAEGT